MICQSRPSASQQKLLDHLVCAAEERDRERKAERLRGLEIDDQLNFCDLLHRQVGRPFTLENATGIDTGLPPSIKNVRSIAHKTADRHELAPGVNRWYGMAGRQRDDLIGMGKKKTVAAHLERVSSLLNKVRKGRLDLACDTCIEDQEPYPMGMRRSL